MTEDVAAGPSADGACETMTDAAPRPAAAPSGVGGGRRLVWVLRLVVTALTAQYTLIAVGTGLSVAATLKYVAPQVIDRFEAVAAALKRQSP